MRKTHVPDPTDCWTPDDARILLDEWQRSGDSLAAFARRRGIAAHRLYWWRRKLSPASAASLSLIPATIMRNEEAVGSSTAAITIRLPNGVSIEIASASASPSLVAGIVAELTRSQP